MTFSFESELRAIAAYLAIAASRHGHIQASRATSSALRATSTTYLQSGLSLGPLFRLRHLEGHIALDSWSNMLPMLLNGGKRTRCDGGGDQQADQELHPSIKQKGLY